jgi:electron transport complex protein RnfE
MRVGKEFFKGVYQENPIFRLALGLCPTLAVTSSAANGLGMGLAATFVLVGSNLIISLVRKLIPKRIRIPCFIVVIATFVSLVEMVMQAYSPQLYKSLGIFVPLIVVNCIILGRAEAFASRNGVGLSLLDGLGMGAGFTLALVIIGIIRELLGSGKIFGHIILGSGYNPALLFILPPGAFLTIGLLMGLFNYVEEKAKR